MARRTRWNRPTRLPGVPGPFRVNLGRRGVSSVGLRIPLGPLGAVTVNLRTRRITWDHPGPGSISSTPEPSTTPRPRRSRRADTEGDRRG